jgi:hypothetical protein
MRSNDPIDMYSPLANKQKPAKNRSTKAPGTRTMDAVNQAANGSRTPHTGPAHATNKGLGL